jgi:hypothetical protein
MGEFVCYFVLLSISPGHQSFIWKERRGEEKGLTD